jgi:hypothetical protein
LTVWIGKHSNREVESVVLGTRGVPASGTLSKREYEPPDKLKPNVPQFFIVATCG